MCERISLRDSPSRFLGSGRGGPCLNLRKGSRLTLGGRLGFKGRGPSGGRGLLSGVTSPALLCRGCCRSGSGVEAVAGAGAWAGAGAGLVPGSFCCLSIMFCSISPVCLTLLVSAGWMHGLTPGLGGGRGEEAGLEGMEVAIGSAFGNLTRPGPAIGGERTVGDSLWWARSFSVTGRIALPNPGRGDFGEPLSQLLVSKVLGLLLNLALRALTSMFSPWWQHRSTNSTAVALFVKQEVSRTARHAPYAHKHTTCQTPTLSSQRENAPCNNTVSWLFWSLQSRLVASCAADKMCAVWTERHWRQQWIIINPLKECDHYKQIRF